MWDGVAVKAGDGRVGPERHGRAARACLGGAGLGKECQGRAVPDVANGDLERLGVDRKARQGEAGRPGIGLVRQGWARHGAAPVWYGRAAEAGLQCGVDGKAVQGGVWLGGRGQGRLGRGWPGEAWRPRRGSDGPGKDRLGEAGGEDR